MTKFHASLRVLIVVCFTLAIASVTQAQATRTWVSGVGDDVNPCSRTAPCKTFAGAISKTAAGGEIDCIDPGGFGAVTITKGITIDGGGTFGSILAAGTNGIIINDAAVTPTAVVTIRNISINGAGTGVNGIRILKAKTVHIENVEILGFTGNGIDAVLTAVATGGTKMYLDDVDIRNLTGAGSIGVKMSTPASFFSASMDHVRIQRIFKGIQVGNNCFPYIRNTVIHGGNGVSTGVEIVAGNGVAAFENTFLVESSTGLSVGAGATARISQTTISDCTTGISGAGTTQSSGNNRILGNTSDGNLPAIVNPK